MIFSLRYTTNFQCTSKFHDSSTVCPTTKRKTLITEFPHPPTSLNLEI